MSYKAKILLDSISNAGVRLTTMEVTFPRFVLAEFNTHRMFCLDGDTRLYFDLPEVVHSKSNTKRFAMTIKEVFEKWHEGAAPRRNKRKKENGAFIDPNKLYTSRELAAAAGYAHYSGIDLLTRRVSMRRFSDPQGGSYRILGADFLKWRTSEGKNRQSLRSRIAAMHLRSCNDETGEIYHTHIKDVCYSGQKEVYRVTLKDGKKIIASADHKFLTEDGWKSLRDAVGLFLSPSSLATWTTAAKLAVNGIPAFTDPNWLRSQRDRGFSAKAIAEEAGVTLDKVKYQLKKYKIKCSNPHLVWKKSHTQEPWNKGRRYCNLVTRGKPTATYVRKGPESHLWRGGITSERKNIGRWTIQHAFRIHRLNNFKCVLCGDGRNLHAHHLDPVAHNITRAYDVNNLTSVCEKCHRDLHQRNLELILLEFIERGNPFCDFWESVGGMRLRKPFVSKKRRTMVRHFVEMESIEFLGVRDTYDIAVEGPFYNFVADGFIVHNSRNSASSRAIPTSKLLERVENNPVLPLEWGLNQKGMSASSLLPEEEAKAAEAVWLAARDAAVAKVKQLQELKVHKQVLNRILEPFMWHTVIVTATEWSNFFELRCSPNAQPEIREAALRMHEVLKESTPHRVADGEWHLPLVQDDERDLDLETLKKISAARCARVSYLTHDGSRDIQKDLDLYERLKNDRHLSPFEHVATPSQSIEFQANFRGWIQLRASIE